MIIDEDELSRIRLRVFEFKKAKLKNELNDGVMHYLGDKCNVYDDNSIAHFDSNFIESIVKIKKNDVDVLFDELLKDNDLKLLNAKVVGK